MKNNSLIIIILVCVQSCIFISGCHFNKNEEKKSIKMEVTQFSHLQRRADQLYYNNTDTIPYSGKVVEYLDSTSVWLEFFCKNGLRDSTEIQWYPNGKLKSKSKYKQGLPVDTIIKWYDTGQKMVVAFFEKGVINGKLTVWYLNGNKFRETNYLDGEKNGFETHWLNNGDTTTMIEYKNDELNGKQIIFNRNGIPRNTTYNEPRPPAIKRKYFVDIAENTKNNNREVPYDKMKWINGRIYVKEEDSPYFGKIAIFQNNKISENVDCINGVLQGNHTKFYDSGAIEFKCCNLWGKFHGLSTGWFENGKIKYDGVATMGFNTGIVRTFNDNGTISSQYDMIQGIQFGTEINYFRNGIKKSLIEYINNEVLLENSWDEKGKLIKSITNKQ
jgi:antitoxin component YwqK of YwqJK toxin-antitoxin module